MRAQFAEALQAFVDASVDGSGWCAPLSLAENALGVRGVILQGIESFAGQLSAAFETSASVPLESVDLYQRHYIDLDIRAEAGGATPHGVAIFDELVGEVSQLDRTEIYAGLYRPFDIGRFVGVRLGASEPAPGAERSLYLTVLRSNESAADVALNEQTVALAHVVRGALRSAAAFSALRAESDTKSAALDRAPFGWILLGDNQSIIHMNTTGADIVSRADGLSCRAGRLVAHERGAQCAIERATARTNERVRAPYVFSLPRPGSQRPYVLMLSPLAYDLGSWLANGVRVAAALFVIDEHRNGAANDAIWRSVFGLSPAESHIAGLLAQGMSKDEIATARGVALATVQTQLKQIYAKLDVNSQAQAAARLLRSAPFSG